MSRARSLIINGQPKWFDTHRNGRKATVDQLELLAASENIEVDDLLDEGLSQGEIILRLRQALSQGVIPAEVLERQRERKIEASKPVVCRICPPGQCEGRITRHHFISKWLMKELENYEAYARRDRCTIPICMGRHRDLHMRSEDAKSIYEYLTDDERSFAQKMLSELEEQHPKIFALLRGGDPGVSYESKLIHDYDAGKFSKATLLTSSEKQVYLQVQSQ